MTTTDVIFAAFLQCETKAYLLGDGVRGARSEVSSLQQHLSKRYKQAATEWLKSDVQKPESVGRPSSRFRGKQGSYVFEPVIESADLRAQPDAVHQTTSKPNGQDVISAPVRFIRAEKPTRADKLLLAFDALAIDHA